MTSHFINYFVRRLEFFKLKNKLTLSTKSKLNSSDKESIDQTFTGEAVDDCEFCQIIRRKESAHIVFENAQIICFLDILPIRPGHLLLVPKKHYARLSQLPDEIAREMGNILPSLSRSLCRAMDQNDFNVVSNNGYAQIVHHLHIHLVPAPNFKKNEVRSGWSSIVGREELDDEEGAIIATRIRLEMDKETRTSKL